MKLSIIIPVYNVANYVGKCLDSCLEQNVKMTDYEIIVVNDGSVDNSLEVVNLYINRPNINVISQNNSGLSAARNAGMKIAKGEYIWFVDSDDWIESGILEHILREISLYTPDCLRLNYRRMTDDEKKIEDCFLSTCCYESCQEGMDFLQKELSFSFYAWAFVFKRHFLERYNFHFAEGLIFEDLQLIPRILRKADVKALPFMAYNYRQRKGSIVNTVNEKMLDSVCEIMKSYQGYINSISNERERRYFILLLNRVKIMFLVLLGNFKNNVKKREYLSDFQKDFPFIKILAGMSLKEKSCAAIYNYSPQLLCWLFNLKYLLK